jgi:hypothetical protein
LQQKNAARQQSSVLPEIVFSCDMAEYLLFCMRALAFFFVEMFGSLLFLIVGGVCGWDFPFLSCQMALICFFGEGSSGVDWLVVIFFSCCYSCKLPALAKPFFISMEALHH